MVRCPLVCNGCYQGITDKGDTYTRTPLFISLKLLLLFGFPKNYSFNLYDVSTAFLHAELKEQVYVRPPVEFYPNGGVLWELQEAMYRLKAAPNAWQAHFAEAVVDMGTERVRSEPSVYCFPDKGLYAMSYADDVLTAGLQDSSGWFYAELSQLLSSNLSANCELSARTSHSLVEYSGGALRVSIYRHPAPTSKTWWKSLDWTTVSQWALRLHLHLLGRGRALLT